MRKIIFFMFLISNIIFARTVSWYGRGFEGKVTSSGYIFDSNDLTCASNRYPFGTVLKVTNRDNGKSVKVVVTDTGSFSKKYGRDLDLSRGAFQKIASLKTGIISADIRVVNQKHIFKYKKGAPHFTNQDYRRFLR